MRETLGGQRWNWQDQAVCNQSGGQGMRPLLLAAKATLVAASLAAFVLGCGSDAYSGTWQATFSDGSHNTMVIAKSGDGWTISDKAGNSKPYFEKDDKLVPAAGDRSTVFVKRGDKLVLMSDDIQLNEYTKL
jgi:hypothetical protein